jgi:hypothetical protein
MWQSKKTHTSFVKSFLHHEPEARSDPQTQESHKKTQQQPAPKKDRKGKNTAKDLIEASDLGGEEIFLKVLGI